MNDREKRRAILEAINVAGSQAALGKLCGLSQQRISKLLRREIPVRAEDAVVIERATGIPRWQLRPDLWAPPLDEHQAEAVGLAS